jgi:hypothetical protein
VIISKIFQGLVISHGDPLIKASLPFAPFNSSLTANPSAPLKDRQTSPTICKNKIRRWWGRRFGVWPCSSTTSLTLAFFWWINTFDFPLQRIEILLRWIIIFEIPMLFGTQERQKERAPYLAAFIRAMSAGMFSCAGWIAGLVQK